MRNYFLGLTALVFSSALDYSGLIEHTHRERRKGTRVPSYEFVPKLLKMAEENDIQLENYYTNDGKGNNRSIN